MARQSKAIMACAKWLSYCLSIGWAHSDLDALDGIWWNWHDDYGRLLEQPRDKSPL